MGRWARSQATIIVGLILVGGAIVWTGWAYRLPPSERSDVLALFGIVLGIVGALPLLIEFGRWLRPGDSLPVDDLADRLAQAVDTQWRKEAKERMLLTPDPIPIRWSLSELPVTGPVTAAVGQGEGSAFPPLPPWKKITKKNLRDGGGRVKLHHVYAGLASGRIVVIGAPGVGKSGTAILLLLDALAHRRHLDDTRRALVPVPVLLTARGWDPYTCSAAKWLHDQLIVTYPLFGSRDCRAGAAALVLARDKVTLILDGLDEMDATLRPAALQALSDAPFRVVVLSRSEEMLQAASRTWLVGAVAVHLHNVSAPDAVDYLWRARTGPPPAGWKDLLNHVLNYPGDVLARGLSTPLTLTLLRDTYQADDDVSPLLDRTRYSTTEAIEQHLVARILPTAYTRHAGRPPPRYTEEQARRTLSFIALHMGEDRDFAWWYVSRWVSTVSRVLTTVLAAGVAAGLALGLAVGFTHGLAVGLTLGFTHGFAIGLEVGLAVELAVGLAVNFGREANGNRIANWHGTISLHTFGRALAIALAIGLAGGMGAGLAAGRTAGLAVGVAAGLSFGVACGLVVGSLSALTGGTGPGLSMSPYQVWRSDRLSGFAFGFPFGLGVTLAGVLVGGVVGGLVGGFATMVATVLATSETWSATLAWFQLRLSRQVLAVRLIPFIEDARKRDILRTVGAVYQFRHSKLQDQLAREDTVNSATS